MFFISPPKALFLLEKIKNFKYSNFMTSSNASAYNKKYISLNNLRNRLIVSIKFGQFMSYRKRKGIIKKFYKDFDLKTSSRPFFVCKKLNNSSTGK